MKMEGTSFQKLVWTELLSIPYGEVRTYKQIAEAIGKPGSSRAVANACAANPYPPAVPCHRVIRSDGTIGGYSGDGGMEEKAMMLEEEGFLATQK
ncbi:MAG TPA: MGMT family protein [Candidatus Thalassarchaeaceae archaeon]|jgi:methylated-DNA-[protein]-cysteine S-methyltransferase|nr:MAG TPA: MGMT family protein [Candidatus Poseidoniales archaeon]HII35061.1 MGMT family protein [Candidatus Thalassarchaeaceae archaeon]|tara:strand:- start:5442 stop:5726 length:285 start_codon:yes stop_codon:yes gene_type:complete